MPPSSPYVFSLVVMPVSIGFPLVGRPQYFWLVLWGQSPPTGFGTLLSSGWRPRLMRATIFCSISLLGFRWSVYTPSPRRLMRWTAA